MAITRIKVTNFKSFDELDLELGPFNVLVGANASGKTNFVQIFKFLRDIDRYSLEDAIALQGGVESLRNMKVDAAKNLVIEVGFDDELIRKIFQEMFAIDVQIRQMTVTYHLELRFKQRAGRFEVMRNDIRMYLTIPTGDSEVPNQFEVIYDGISHDIVVEATAPSGEKRSRPVDFASHVMVTDKPAMEVVGLYPFSKPWFPSLYGGLVDSMAIYNFDVQLPKKATPIAGRASLEENGENLVLVVQSLLRRKETRSLLVNRLRDFLGLVKDVKVERTKPGESLVLKLQERYTPERLIPAAFVSDGTINILALTVALLFESKSIVFIEEPERNIHPYLISRLVQLMEEVSEEKKKQILITTHNPEFVKHAGLDALLLVSRDKNGFTQITRPADKPMVRTFLEHDVGLDTLHIQDLLGD